MPRAVPGMTMSMLLPRPEIVSAIHAVAPRPIDCMRRTAPTPMTIPSIVRDERILFRSSAENASDVDAPIMRAPNA